MQQELTKESLKVFKVLYLEYRRRRKTKIAKDEAIEFVDTQLTELFHDSPDADIDFAINEIADMGFCKTDVIGGVKLQDVGIKYMEQRPKEFFNDVVGFVKDAISLIP